MALLAVGAAAVIAAFLYFCALHDNREYHILSVSATGDMRVTEYALALAETRYDFPVDDALLENVLTDNRDGLPAYITEVVVFEDGLVWDGTYTGKISAEMVLRKKSTVLAVFRTADGELRYAYIRYRPRNNYDIILPDGSFPTPNTEVAGYLYEGADLMNYPVLSVREARETVSPEKVLGTDDIRVQIRRVGYIPDHHGVFGNAHHG